jgi:hypothetical protein
MAVLFQMGAQRAILIANWQIITCGLSLNSPAKFSQSRQMHFVVFSFKFSHLATSEDR